MFLQCSFHAQPSGSSPPDWVARALGTCNWDDGSKGGGWDQHLNPVGGRVELSPRHAQSINNLVHRLSFSLALFVLSRAASQIYFQPPLSLRPAPTNNRTFGFRNSQPGYSLSSTQRRPIWLKERESCLTALLYVGLEMDPPSPPKNQPLLAEQQNPLQNPPTQPGLLQDILSPDSHQTPSHEHQTHGHHET